MPVSWRIETELVWLESSAQATLDEWREALEAVLADPRYRPGMGLVHDRRKLAWVPTTEQVTAATNHIAGRSMAIGKARWGLVVAGAAGFGMGRMAEILLERTSVTLGVFRDLDEAEAWVRDTSG